MEALYNYKHKRWSEVFFCIIDSIRNDQWTIGLEHLTDGIELTKGKWLVSLMPCPVCRPLDRVELYYDDVEIVLWFWRRWRLKWAVRRAIKRWAVKHWGE